MEVDLHNTYNKILIKMIILTMMMKMIIALTQSIFKLGPPDLRIMIIMIIIMMIMMMKMIISPMQ